MSKQFLYSLAFFGFIGSSLYAQNDEDVLKVREIYDNTLTESSCYDWLGYLCKNIGHRVSGSAQNMAAVEYTRQMLDTIGLDKVWLQPVMVPHWSRGTIEKARIINSPTLGTEELSIVALGFSKGTNALGVTGEVIEVKSIDELKKLGKANVQGKIVFFNRPMDPLLINTFHAYGRAVDQRGSGPKEASLLGAKAAIVRSMTLKQDDIPHSGMTNFKEEAPIPAVGMGIQSAEKLSALLKEEKVTINIRLNCEHLGMKPSYNVIGEIKGSEYPDEIILVGGHLDSWDIGEGAHDDGSGCVQAMEVLHLFNRMKIKPKHTLRVVLFANEENGMEGAKKYAAEALKNDENHIAAIESDAGGHTPRGFVTDALPNVVDTNLERVQGWKSLLAPYGAYYMHKGGSGADVSKLRGQGTMLFGFRPDSQRYFDYHHARTDVFESINKRELELGAGAMSTLVYLIDQYGFKIAGKEAVPVKEKVEDEIPKK